MYCGTVTDGVLESDWQTKGKPGETENNLKKHGRLKQ